MGTIYVLTCTAKDGIEYHRVSYIEEEKPISIDKIDENWIRKNFYNTFRYELKSEAYLEADNLFRSINPKNGIRPLTMEYIIF